jgi:hypothetical protein
MKNILLSSALTVLLFACNESNDQSKENNADSISRTEQTGNNVTVASIDAALDSYLLIKNALTEDNGNAAAKAAKDLNEKLQSYGASQLNDAQRKVYADVQEEVLEHSKHIADNAGKIDHQRNHFDLLSVVMYDLVKSDKVDKILYKQYCPMYNDKKGGVWLSETKEIKNPFYGKSMLDCGEVKEEIK